MLRCPVCKRPLLREEKRLCCEHGHSFDLSSSGYVNLLLPSKKHSPNPGDSKEMILARRDFLSRGYYEFLREKLVEEIRAHLRGREHPALADVGCGEGYYTRAFAKAVKEQSPDGVCYGFDLAKDGLRCASKRDADTLYAVASLADLPLQDGCLDLLLDIFAPYNSREFARVLKGDGLLITAVPAQEHLFGLKQALYERPYKNILAPYEMEDFVLRSIRRVHKTVTISPAQDIENLFLMTPYYWKTSREAAAKLQSLSELETCLDFGIIVYERRGGM